MNTFRKNHRSTINNNLMAWYVTSVGSVPSDGTSATDGDLDNAYALLLAHKKWGGNYLSEARTLIAAIKESLMAHTTKRTKLGDWQQWGNDTELNTRSSDWRPGHFRAFADATNDNFWREAADTVYLLLRQTANPTTGLMPDFATGQPARPDPTGGGVTGEHNKHHFAYNACRTPWFIALDYAHYGTPAAKEHIDRISAWLRNANGVNLNATSLHNTHIGSMRTLAGQYINSAGTVITSPTYTSLAFAAPFASAMIANPNNQDALNRTYTNIARRITQATEYEHAIQLLNMLLLAGKWEAP
jgi:endo-1,4-beta-D-glucanase Y